MYFAILFTETQQKRMKTNEKPFFQCLKRFIGLFTIRLKTKDLVWSAV